MKEFSLLSREVKEPKERVELSAMTKLLLKKSEYISPTNIERVAKEIRRELEVLFARAHPDGIGADVVAGVILRKISGKGLQDLREKMPKGAQAISDEDFAAAWEPIWQAVFVKLQALLAQDKKKDILVFLEKHQIVPGVIALHNGYIQKHPFDDKRKVQASEQAPQIPGGTRTIPMNKPRSAELIDDGDTAEHQRHEALRVLFDSPERSPNLAYHVAYLEERKGKRRGEEIQHELSMMSLNDIVKDRQREFPLQRVLAILLGAMRGVQFLIDHDLRLTDLALQNIVYNEITGEGMLFDYDALRTKDAVLSVYLGRVDSGYIPPERLNTITISKIQPQKQKSPLIIQKSNPKDYARLQTIQESDMVFEFGVSLRKCLEAYGEKSPESEVVMLAADMTNIQYRERPMLKDAIARLEHLIDR